MYSILIPTYKNPKYLKLCVDSILENSYYKTHQLCIHVNGYDQETVDYLNSKNIKYTLTQNNIGIMKAGKICISQSTFNKILSANDDMYFYKNWDYNLHKWETELENKFPTYKFIIGYRLCEPIQGSFLPICDAGKDIKTFNINKLNEYVKKYSSHDMNDEWLSNALYPKDILLKCYSEDFKSKIFDIDIIMNILKYYKNNNIKFLIIRVNDCFVYHFSSIVTKRLEKQNITEPNEVHKFENKWNISTDTALNKILRNEVTRSMKLISGFLENSKIPTISTYITTHNSLFYQSTLEQTIRHALLFSDEIIVVNSEHSTDGTQNLLDQLHSEYPNIIKLYTFKEDYSKLWNTVTEKKTFALKQCTKNYCILQDDDEVIHEHYENYVKQLPQICPETIAFRFNTIHFYRSYNRYQPKHPNWYDKKIYMIKNIPEIKHGKVNEDPDNHIITFPDKDNSSNEITYNTTTIPLDSLPSPKIINTPITSYHYGWCRNDAILLLKKYHQDRQWHGNEYWKTHQFPFKFENPENLPKFEGTHPKYMIPTIEHEQKLNSRHIKEFTA